MNGKFMFPILIFWTLLMFRICSCTAPETTADYAAASPELVECMNYFYSAERYEAEKAHLVGYMPNMVNRAPFNHVSTIPDSVTVEQYIETLKETSGHSDWKPVGFFCQSEAVIEWAQRKAMNIQDSREDNE